MSARDADFIAAIGLETHVQLRTRTKLFCGCPNRFGAEPNTLVCPVCLGLPGSLPVANREAIRLTARAGWMLGGRVQRVSRFDRKSYFYPDMPKNFQISQYDLPLCVGGGLDIETNGARKTIRLTRIHLEEDVGKCLHFEASSGLDFNRAGTPLMEIVTEPDLASPDEALAFLLALKQILVYGGISDCNLEQGNLRCDVNCSVRPAGAAVLGVKTEIKNMNTFKGVHRALSYEIRRQIETLRAGGTICQETRRWDDAAGRTETMRTKEYAHDYRYFPEPDLLPVELDEALLEAWRAELPELPAARRERFVRDYGLPDYDAGVLTADPAVADYFEAAVRAGAPPKAASNWVMTEVLRAIGERGIEIGAVRVTPEALAGLLGMLERRRINGPTAKEVFAILFEQGGDPETIVREHGLDQVSDAGAVEDWAARAIEMHPNVAADFRAGKKPALQFLVGQVMKLSRGKADPRLAAEALRRRLEG
jgi:aspartyl-tRNA(Asn)/glutamyl-tRNA(Gln) amidotransferase subunit B